MVSIKQHVLKIQSDPKLLSGFPFIGHGKNDNNLESSCVWGDWRYINKHCYFSSPVSHMTKTTILNFYASTRNSLPFVVIVFFPVPITRMLMLGTTSMHDSLFKFNLVLNSAFLFRKLLVSEILLVILETLHCSKSVPRVQIVPR